MAAGKTLTELVGAVLRGRELLPSTRDILKRLEAGAATWEDVNRLAQQMGSFTGLDLAAQLRELDGTVTREELLEALERLVPEYLKRDYDLVSEASARMMQAANQRAGIGLKVQRSELDRDRVHGLIEELRGKEDFSAFSDVLRQQVENFSGSIVTDTIRSNAQAHYAAGLRPKIVRTTDGGCCAWCSALAGTYDYAEVRDTGNDVYRRHTNCNCVVEYRAGERTQNVWTKQQYRADPEERAERMRRAGVYQKMRR